MGEQRNKKYACRVVKRDRDKGPKIDNQAASRGTICFDREKLCKGAIVVC